MVHIDNKQVIIRILQALNQNCMQCWCVLHVSGYYNGASVIGIMSSCLHAGMTRTWTGSFFFNKNAPQRRIITWKILSGSKRLLQLAGKFDTMWLNKAMIVILIMPVIFCLKKFPHLFQEFSGLSAHCRSIHLITCTKVRKCMQTCNYYIYIIKII